MSVKVRILILFVFIAAFSVVSVFYVKNYFFYSAKNEIVKPDLITKEVIFKALKTNFSVLRDYDGQVLSNSALDLLSQFTQNDKIKSSLIIHFWASWCDPCVNEIPELLNFIDRNKNEIDEKKLSIILISLDYDQESLSKFLISFPGLKNASVFRVWDSQGVLQKTFDIDRLPSTFIYNEDNSLERFFTVVDWKRR